MKASQVLQPIAAVALLGLCAVSAWSQNNVEKKDIVIRDTHSYFPAKCPSKRVLEHQEERGVGAYNFDIESGTIENGRVQIEGDVIGYRCDALDQQAGEYLWRPVLIGGNPTVQVLLQATSGKYRRVRFLNQRKFVYEDTVDQFFGAKDLEDFLQNRNLGIKSFDTLIINRDQNGGLRNDYTPVSRTYFYELVPAGQGSAKIRFVKKP
jgi:hypothetical protein